MQEGIAISFIRMKTIMVDDSGKFAELGPGLTNGELIRGLWAQGKQTGKRMAPPTSSSGQVV